MAERPNWQKWTGATDWAESAMAGNDAIQEAVAGVRSAAELIRDIADALDVVEALLARDPVNAVFTGFARTLAQLISDLENTDVYVLPMLPHSWEDLLHPYTTADAISDFSRSLQDRCDPNRPLFGEGGAFCMVSMVVGADNWMDFRRLLKLLSDLFSEKKWARFADLRFQFDKYKWFPVPREERNSQGQTWDWKRTNLTQLIPGFGDMMRRLQDLMDSLMGYPAGVAQFIRDLADLLIERLDVLDEVLQEIAKVAEFLANLAKLVPNAAILGTDSADGGTAKMQEILVNAGNRPEHKLCGGVVLVFASGNPVAYFNLFKTMLGMQFQSVEQAAGQAEAGFSDGGAA